MKAQESIIEMQKTAESVVASVVGEEKLSTQIVKDPSTGEIGIYQAAVETTENNTLLPTIWEFLEFVSTFAVVAVFCFVAMMIVYGLVVIAVSVLRGAWPRFGRGKFFNIDD